jgi:general secretion pathway protein K
VLQLNPVIADQLLDWLDVDSSPRPQGAEDNIYRNRQPPALAANRILGHISELRLLPAMDASAWQRLEAFVQASPQRGSRININTAPAEVLLSLADGITRQMINSVIRQRGGGFNKLSEFLQQSVFENINIDPRGLDVHSFNYQAIAEIHMDGEISRFETLLQRSGKVYHVLFRRRILL